MNWNPLNPDQINKLNLWEKGTYDFQIIDAKKEVSKSGKDMIHLMLKVFNKEGIARLIDDYILLDDIWIYKWRNSLYSIELGHIYEAGTIDEGQLNDLHGKCGKAKVGVSIDKTGIYKDKNNILDYVISDEAPKVVKLEKADFDDDIGF